MTNITNKMTKQELANYLEEVLADDKYVLQDKSLVDMITYTLKKFAEDAKQVLKADLFDVAKELSEYIAPKQETLTPVETKLKPVSNKEKAKVETEPTKEESDVKELPKKKAGKKETAKKLEPQEDVKLPTTLDTEHGKYTLVTEGIDSVKDLEKAVTEGRDIVLAVYWSKKLLKQFDYTGDQLFDDVKSFPSDYDLRKPVYFLDNGKALYALSLYTESMGIFRDSEFDQVEGVRYCNKAEYGIYENLEVDIEELEAEEETK